MTKNVFGSKSAKMEKKLDGSSFVQKPYFRTSFVESIIEGEIDMKSRHKIKITYFFPTKCFKVLC